MYTITNGLDKNKNFLVTDENNFNSVKKTTTLANRVNCSESTKNLAAKTIQRFFKKIVAEKSYRLMFDEGEYFRQYPEISLPTVSPFENLAKLQTLSTRFINEIKQDLGKLSKKEQQFLRKTLQLPDFSLKHQTCYNLEKKDKNGSSTIAIYSHQLLKEKNITVGTTTSKSDIQCLRNNDFVFFSVDFSGSFIHDRPATCITGTNEDYGYLAYIIRQQPQDFSFFTLTDHYYNKIGRSGNTDRLIYQFPVLNKHIHRLIHGRLGKKDIPIFTQKDMRSALAYHTIAFVRKCDNIKFSDYIYSNITEEQINIIFNTIFNPEIHIPRILSSYIFATHTLREPTLQECYKQAIITNDTKKLSSQIMKESINGCIYNLSEIAKFAIKDMNLDFIKYCYDSICELGKNDVSISSLRIIIAILEKDRHFILTHKINIDSYNIYSFLDIMQNTTEYNDLIKLHLNELLKEIDKSSYFNKHLLLEDCLHYLVMLGEYKHMYLDIDKQLIGQKTSRILFTSIHTRLSLLFDKLTEYRHCYQINCIQFIAETIVKYKITLNEFIESFYLYVQNYTSPDMAIIDEDVLFATISHDKLSQNSKSILKESFLQSGILNPDKIIEQKNISENKSLRIVGESSKYIYQNESLRNYALRVYKIEL